MPETIVTKRCFKCNSVKPVTEFPKDRARRDGLQATCKSCAKEQRRARYAQRKREGPMDISTKTCSKCGQTKPISEFYRNPISADGYFSHCKKCHRAQAIQYEQTAAGRSAQYRGNHTEASRERRHVYKQSEKGKECYRDYYRRNKHKNQARLSVREAVLAGKLPRADTCVCECGAPAIEYHHWSYAPQHWLDVIPVCRLCHTNLHTTSNNLGVFPSSQCTCQSP